MPLLLLALIMLPANLTYATNADRELTDDELAAFIVRDEWTSWVRSFTASLSELDKNATAKIYDDMDFYDMQYRFTEKYKKVPEYLDEDGKPTQLLKDMIAEKRREIHSGTSYDYLKFTSTGETNIYYMINETVNIDMGYSTDGNTWKTWAAGTASMKTLRDGETLYVWNKSNTLSTSDINYVSYYNW